MCLADEHSDAGRSTLRVFSALPRQALLACQLYQPRHVHLHRWRSAAASRARYRSVAIAHTVRAPHPTAEWCPRSHRPFKNGEGRLGIREVDIPSLVGLIGVLDATAHMLMVITK